jgi:hypothetical protein
MRLVATAIPEESDSRDKGHKLPIARVFCRKPSLVDLLTNEDVIQVWQRLFRKMDFNEIGKFRLSGKIR